MMTSSNWALYRSAGYLNGRGVTLGMPVVPPQAINPGAYSLCVDILKTPGAVVVEEDLSIIAEGSLDHVFLGKRLESIYEPEKYLREAVGKLKVGGHLLIHSRVGHFEAGMHEFYPEGIKEMVRKVGHWQEKASYEEEKESLQIFKKLQGKKGVEPQKPRSGKPRACVIRYGAIGDAIIMSPLLKKLDEDGYEVTVNLTPYSLPALQNNPHIHNFIVQEKDCIPNLELGKYWDLWRGEYDRYINLSESLEGGLLKVEGRLDFYTSKAWREKKCSVNYYDHTMGLGGYPDEVGHRGEIFFTRAEERKAKEFFEPLAGKFVIVWALNGSSHHKVYPLMEPVLKDWLELHPDAVVVTVGDQAAQLAEFEHPQVICKSGVWKIREALISTKYAGVVVGPETAMTNAAGCFKTPKITFLSHSTHENLCKHWENDFCLTPNTQLAACYPCHQLHYTREGCPMGSLIDEATGHVVASGPVCAMGAISGERLKARLDEVYETWKRC
jgi:ADP-heptose:LPS heptosyltransferase